MKRWLILALGVVAVAGCGKSEDPSASAPARVSGIDLQYVDAKVKPQEDFFRHVNGVWLDKTEIPSDKATYGAFVKLHDDAQEQLRTIIEEAAAKRDKIKGSDEQKVGDMYASFMDEARIEELGAKPISAELARIDALKSKNELPALFAHLSRIGVTGPIGGFVNQDAKDSTQYTVYLYQNAMIGLPDRDYYLEDTERFRKVREAYQVHIAKMLGLLGAGEEQAQTQAKAIVALETELAEKHWTRVDSRDDDKTYNRFELSKLNQLTPGFDFAAYLRESGVTAIPAVIVMQPSAFTGFAQQLQAQPLSTWQAYLRWKLVSSFAPYLSKEFVDENFAFYSGTLRGIEENRPRWKRGVEAVENTLGEVLGKIYVARHFPPEAKARMETLVKNLTTAYEQSIRSLEWMSEETKKKALEKLGKFTPKIGYPNKWKDYSALQIAADDLVGNVMRSNVVEHNREMAKLGKPIDREEWFMTPQTVNAYYNPGMNEIVFPAAILQPPFFNLKAEDAVNYGGIGAVIGHEIGHGFDDQGSKYDGDGNLKSWWTDADRKAFEDRTRQLIAQYDQYEPIKGYRVNGALTIGENIGDLGGLSIAYKAYQLALDGKPAPVIDGLTGDQRFFMGWAQVWRGKVRDEALIERLKADPHSPYEYRTNGVLVNIPQFYTAFDVKEGDPMYLAPEKRVRIW